MGDGLVTFLRARLTEEREAAEAAQADWVVRAKLLPMGHVQRWAPERVLAEVDAKRRILDRHTPKEKHHNPKQPVCAECGGSEWRADIVDGQEVQQPYPWVMPWPCPTLRLLAVPYAQQPQYREEWKP